MLEIAADPTRYEKDILKFEKEDQSQTSSNDLVLFTGSSTIRLWKTLKKDMAPLPVLNRGFGGSWLPDAIHYFSRIVLAHTPKAIVLYSGENDIASQPVDSTVSGVETLNNFQAFYEKVRFNLPDTLLFYISIKPPKKRINFKLQMEKANRLIEDFCEIHDNCFFIDICSILSENGRIKKHISKRDGIHLNKKGYKLMNSVIKPILYSHLWK